MKTLTPFLIGFLIAGAEPFFPFGSPAIAFAAVLGTKYQNSHGLIAVILVGLIRDVLLVNRLGTSSAIAALAWTLAALGVSRLGRPLMVSIAAAAVSAVPAGFFPGPASYQFVLATAALAGALAAVWNFISERNERIKVR